MIQTTLSLACRTRVLLAGCVAGIALGASPAAAAESIVASFDADESTPSST